MLLTTTSTVLAAIAVVTVPAATLSAPASATAESNLTIAFFPPIIIPLLVLPPVAGGFSCHTADFATASSARHARRAAP